MTVFVVDDEQIVRDYFAQGFPWQQAQMEWIGDAGDGETALERCRLLHPDLVLLDITMPGLDGLEVLARLNKEMPYVNCVLLTCHQEFRYVQTALRLGAVDYIVKAATTPDEMLGKLEQVRQRIDLKRNQARLSTLQRQWLSQALRQAPPAPAQFETDRRKLRLPLHNAPFVALLLQIQSSSMDDESALETGEPKLHLHAQAALDAVCAGMEAALWAEVRPDHYLVVTNISHVHTPTSHGHATAREQTNPIAQALRDQVQARLGAAYNVAAGVSALHPNLEQLTTALREAEHALSARFYFDSTLLLCHEAPWRNVESSFLAEFEPIASSPLSAQANIVQQLEQRVESAIALCRRHHIDPQVARMLLMHLVQRQVESLGGAVSRWELAVWPIQVAKLTTAAHLQTWATQIASTLMVASGRLGLRPEIQRVIEDLHEHLAQHYDLTRAAAVAGLHPNYFSAVFRAETGQTFSEYLGRLRMELAARYLQEGVWSMQQIAEMVGIANYRTFYNTFRRMMGVNPSEFANCVDSIPIT